MEKTQYEMVKDFLFAKNPPSHPTFPNKDVRVLVFKLIFEELLEYAIACGTEDAVQCIEEAQRMISKFEDKFGIDVTFEEHDQVHEPNMVEILDAAIDLQVVLNNLIVYFGFTDFVPDVFNEVMRANMKKLSMTKKEADEDFEAVKNKYPDRRVGAFISPFGYMFMDANSGKILKPTWFRDPRIAALLADNLLDVEFLDANTLKALNLIYQLKEDDKVKNYFVIETAKVPNKEERVVWMRLSNGIKTEQVEVKNPFYYVPVDTNTIYLMSSNFEKLPV